MRVKLLHDGGYEGLVNVQFPVEVEVEREGYGNVYVGWDAISAIPGWFYHKNDAYEGGSYCFYKDEVEIIDQEVEARISALRETGITLFPKLSEDEKRALLYIEDEPAVSAECCVDTRKDKLISLVRDYGEIKFSSLSKDYISVSPENNIYMRGQDCLFNNRVLPEPYLGYGTKNAMEIVTRYEFEQFYFTKENK